MPPPIGSLEPDDLHNQALVANVHPPDWKNPSPNGRYNLVVVGAGSAGLVAASIAAGLGAKVALIERYLMGGDCLNVGCVPSKVLVNAARLINTAKRAAEFSDAISNNDQIDFDRVMDKVRQVRSSVSAIDSADRYTKLGVDIFFGSASFTSHNTVDVDGITLQFSKAVICSGTRPASPNVPGLAEAGYLTNENIFSITKLPRRLGVIGAGPIGCELAQSFARFGSAVTLIEQQSQLLPRDEPAAAAVLLDSMKRDGVACLLDTHVHTVTTKAGVKQLHYSNGGQTEMLDVDQIFIAIGRIPNVDGLGLETAGVSYDGFGVTVDPTLRTSNSNIYAAGDVCSTYKFTHAADAMAKIVIQNALFPHPLGYGMASVDSLDIPWCTYTDPEVAHVGMDEATAKAKGIEIDTYTQPLSEVDRATIEGESNGFARIHVRKGTDKILGATIVASQAGNLISEITIALKARVGLQTIGNTIHPYPTHGETLYKAAIKMRKARFTIRQQAWLKWFFGWFR